VLLPEKWVSFPLLEVFKYRVFLVAVLMFGGKKSSALPDWREKLRRWLFDPLTFYAQKPFLYRCLTAL